MIARQLGKDSEYLLLRRQAHQRNRKLGIGFTAAFDLVAQDAGYRDCHHAIHWLMSPNACWWGPIDPPTVKAASA